MVKTKKAKPGREVLYVTLKFQADLSSLRSCFHWQLTLVSGKCRIIPV